MWSEEPGITKVLFNTYENDWKISIYLRYMDQGAKYDQGSV